MYRTPPSTKTYFRKIFYCTLMCFLTFVGCDKHETDETRQKSVDTTTHPIEQYNPVNEEYGQRDSSQTNSIETSMFTNSSAKTDVSSMSSIETDVSEQRASLSLAYPRIEVKRWTLAEWCSQTKHDRSTNQSCVAYDKYVFLFSPGSPSPVALIVDLSNPYGEVCCASIPASAHANSAQFIDVFFNETDEFPLLILSNCEANGKTNSMSVIRVTRTNDEFSFSLLKKVFFATPGMVDYGSSLTFDVERRKLISVYNPNGNWMVPENNPIIFKEFSEPNWLDGHDELYDDDSGIIIAMHPFFIFQGTSFDNGKLFVGCSFPLDNHNWEIYEGKDGSKECVLVINSTNGEVLYSIPAEKGYEIEGVSVCDNHLFVTQRASAVDEDETATILFEYDLR